MAEPTQQPAASDALGSSYRSGLGSFMAGSPIAGAAIAQDVQDEQNIEDGGDAGDFDVDLASVSSHGSISRLLSHGYSMTGSYRRPSLVAMGISRSTAWPTLQPPETGYLTKGECEQVIAEERRLLQDCDLLPPSSKPRRGSHGSASGFLASHLPRKLSIRNVGQRAPAADEGAARLHGAQGGGNGHAATETSPLLKPFGEDNEAGAPFDDDDDDDSPRRIDQKWEEAVSTGKVHTTWQREAKVLAKYSRSLILTFLLQYSLNMAPIFTVGHIGKAELGAVSLASMTANITGYSVYMGLATSLDTLCAQAYGSGHPKLVGLQLQRMVFFLWCITIPIAIVWLCGSAILGVIVPEKRTAELAGLYLRILIAGAPGYAAFESGKRFVQAQGLFSATLYILLLAAPLNAFMNWLFVWKFELGFVGAPIATVITENLMPICLVLYVRYVNGRECWGGFDRRALKNWGPMVRLALPGLVMVLAEFLAFEILTLSASWISSTHLAAQSVLASLTALTFQLPFPISVAASTRIANLIGATLPDAAKIATKVALFAACIVGVINITLLVSLRHSLPWLFTNDHDVVNLVANTLPLCAAFQIFDALAANCNGILRGLGKQEVGGYVNLVAYYVIAIPISFGTGFGLHWNLYGLWAGPAIALCLVSAVEGWFIRITSWEKAVQEAQARNAQG